MGRAERRTISTDFLYNIVCNQFKLGYNVEGVKTYPIDRRSGIKEVEKLSPSYIRNKYRPKNHPLLLIYILKPHSHGKERTVSSSPLSRKPLKTADIDFAISFVFPK